VRTRLGIALSLSLVGTLLMVGVPVGAGADADGPMPVPPVVPTTTTTVPTTTVPTTTAPPVDAEPVDTEPVDAAPVDAAPAEARSGDRIDGPVRADRTAERSASQFELATPPAPPTTQPPLWVLPPNSGEGRRIVYSKTNQWVWTVEADGRISKHHAVSGRRTWNQPLPGEYRVFSRSAYTCNINNPSVCWRYMVRFTVGPGGDNIGFHEIPTNTQTGNRLQGDWQLGQALSAGCIRQATPDALYIWNWAPVGTKVVVLP